MSDRPVAFVTGASRGIGRGIALELARAGFNIVGGATTSDPAEKSKGLAEVRQVVEQLGAAFEPAVGDIADLSVHERLLSVALERFGRVDVLVNNAGIAPRRRRDVLETTPKIFDEILAVNTRGTFFLTQLFARQMLRQDRVAVRPAPTIIFISSVSAHLSSLIRAEYCISKAAISHAATIFADRLAESGIKVYDIRPGLIETDMTAPVKEQYDAQIASGMVPQRRWGTPADIGRAVAALARGDFDYATGLVLEISGGMNIRRL